MMQSVKYGTRHGARALRFSGSTPPRQTPKLAATAPTTDAPCDVALRAANDADTFETTAVRALLHHLAALRPSAATHRGVWYPQTFEAHRRAHTMPLPYDFWTGHADTAFFDKLHLHTFRVRPLQSADAALSAFAAGPTVADCGSAIAAAQWQVIRGALGAPKFDAVFGSAGQATHERLRMQISGFVTPWEPLTYFIDFGPTALSGGAFERSEAKRGDVYYIRGVPGYDLKHPDGPGQGYNVVYAGDDASGEPLFTGFDLHPAQTETQIRTLLVAYHNDARTPRAEAYIRHSACPGAYDLRAAGVPAQLPPGTRGTHGFLAGAQRRMRFDRLLAARALPADKLADKLAEHVARRLEEHASKLGLQQAS